MKNDISILVVDDEAMMRDLLEKILVREGYAVKAAGNGVEALEMLQHEKFDLIISDMKMPNMDGFELLKTSINVIIMTAYGDTYTVKDALLLGADEYITKPFKSHEISLVVERAYWRLLAAEKQKVHDRQ